MNISYIAFIKAILPKIGSTRTNEQ